MKSGDTLSKIARSIKSSLTDLKKWNGIKGHLIYPGQKLKVSNGTSTAAIKIEKPVKKDSAPPKTVQTPAATPPAAQTDYVIQAGDTLSKIGMQFGMTVQELKKLNKLDSDLIFVGQKLLFQTQMILLLL